jgi:RHS repeat-associated protein
VASGTVASWRFADQMGTPGGLYDWQMKACQSGTCSSLTSIAGFEINPMVGSGDRSYFQYLDEPLSSVATAHVNYATGNLAVDWNDLSIAGVNGLNLNFDRTYNSITDETIALSDFGSHWTNALTDPFTAVQSSGGIRLQGPSGYLAEFSKRGSTYVAPSGLDADVVLSGTSTTTITFHHNADGFLQGEQLIFTGDYLHTIEDAHGNTLTLSYYSGAPEVKTITDSQTGRTITMSNYNAAGQAQTVTDNTGRTLTYTYDGSANLSTFADAGHATITGDATTQYSYDSAHELTQITDPAGNVTKIGYTANQVTSLTRGFGSTTDVTTTDFAYYPLGDTHCTAFAAMWACTVVTQDRVNATPMTGGSLETTTYYYDKSDRITHVTDSLGNSAAKTWDVNSNVLTQTDKVATPNTTTIAYDSGGLNNPKTATDPTSAVATDTYTGTGHAYQPDTSNLPNNASSPTSTTTTYSYTAAGSSTAFGDVTQAVQGSTTLKYAYQGDGTTTCGAQAGEVCTTTNGKSGVTTYGYNADGDLTSITPPTPLAASSFTPDALGRVTSSEDGLSQTTTTHYDVLDRVTEVDYPASSKTIKYTYDGDGNVLTVKVTTVGTVTYTFTYDHLNRLTDKTQPANTTVVTDDAYTYDKLGNLLTLTESGVTGGHTLSLTSTYTYGNTNLVATASGTTLDPGGHGATTAAIGISQNNNGLTSKITIGSLTTGETRTLAYDNAGREVETTATKVSGSVKLTDLVYCYVNPVSSCPTTPTGNPTGTRYVVTNNKQQVVDSVGSSTIGYTYDGLNRLTDANTTAGGTDHRSYGYDADGNRTSQTINGTNTTYTFNSADQATTTGYSYDADGNGTATPTLSTLTLNPLNQTTGITKSGTTTNFAYAGGDQTTRTTANNVDASLSSLGTDIEASSGSVYHFYIRDPAGNLLAIVNDNSGTLTTRYPVLDGIGSVIGLTNGTGTVDDTTKYDPYGVVISNTGTDYNPFGYTSGYTDSTTGLIHLGARYYNPADGRFTQPDPSGQESNLYGYAGDNPVTFVDSTGLLFGSFGISINFFDVAHVGIGVDIGSGGFHPFVDAGVGVSSGTPSLLSPIATLSQGASATGGAAAITGCLAGVCTDTNGTGSLDLTGASSVNADVTYTF